MYHRVDQTSGDLTRELLPALPTRLFEAQVRHLASRYSVVPASELLTAVRERRPGDRFPIAITFDDDLRSHVEVVAPILSRAGATATFFLTGASLDGAHRFWWERLQDAFDRRLDLASLGIATAGGIHEVGGTIESLPPSELDRIDEALSAVVGREPGNLGLRADDVRWLAAAGFEIGFHTRRHYRLHSLPDEELHRAMHEGRAELEQVIGRRMTSIAYPHGVGDGKVAAAAEAAGFEAGFTGARAAVVPDAAPLLLGRLSPSYRSLHALAFDVAWTLGRASLR